MAFQTGTAYESKFEDDDYFAVLLGFSLARHRNFWLYRNLRSMLNNLNENHCFRVGMLDLKKNLFRIILRIKWYILNTKNTVWMILNLFAPKHL